MRIRPIRQKMENNNHLEFEVKFLVPDLETMREKILAAGARLEKPRVYEHNISYDNAWGGLVRKAQLLRLRKDRVVRLTFKGEPAVSRPSEAKVREELEVEVSDFEKTAAILERIGFEQRLVYEKYRETFVLGPVEIVLDEMPCGIFVELEGPEEKLKQTADLLGLDWHRRVLESYPFIMTRLKSHFNLPFTDLTFDNFDGLNIAINELYE